jgi:hypothetical protein
MQKKVDSATEKSSLLPTKLNQNLIKHLVITASSQEIQGIQEKLNITRKQ